MSALVCDICGGKLLMSENGEMAACEYCGVQYDKKRMQMKIQEIKGVVEITKGETEKERLIKNAETMLSLDEKDKAKEIYQQIADEYPDDYRGWFGLAEIEMKEIICLLNCIKDDDNLMTKYYLHPNIYGWGVGFENADDIVFAFFRLNNIHKKLLILDNDKATEISKFEDNFVEEYQKKNFHFTNELSLTVITGYKQIVECSSIIYKWAESIVNEYIEKIENGKIDRLLWEVDISNEGVELYPNAITFLKKAHKNALYYNDLSIDEREKLLKKLLDEWRQYDSENDCIYLIGKIIMFSGYGDHVYFYQKKSLLSFSFKGDKLFLSRKSENKCGFCGGRFSGLFTKKCSVCGRVKDY